MPGTSAPFLAVVCALGVLLPASLSAQEPDDGLAPPHLTRVDGAASLEREGRAARAEPGMILTAGDRLRTTAGRVEILFGDGSALHVDRYSTVDLLDEGLIRLTEGRVFMHVAAPPEGYDAVEYRIDTPAASVRTGMAGEYRVAAAGLTDPVTELAVARGLAEVATPLGTVALRAGELVRTRAGEPPGFPLAYNAASWDEFDRWSYAQRRAPLDVHTAANLPHELTPYAATLARHGAWRHHAAHGVVWYPHVVPAWRPFYHGTWTVISPYGWTWVGLDPWTWPTHYYGHWGLSPGGTWFWVPGRRWSAARVHWAIGVGHVAWFPFGVASVHSVAWTVVPRSVFHFNVFVPRHAVGFRGLRPDVRRTFVVQRPPTPRGIAVPRAAVATRRTPVRTEAPRRVAVPRERSRSFATTSVTAGDPVNRRTGSRSVQESEEIRGGQRSTVRRGMAVSEQGADRAVPRAWGRTVVSDRDTQSRAGAARSTLPRRPTSRETAAPPSAGPGVIRAEPRTVAPAPTVREARPRAGTTTRFGTPSRVATPVPRPRDAGAPAPRFERAVPSPRQAPRPVRRESSSGSGGSLAVPRGGESPQFSTFGRPDPSGSRLAPRRVSPPPTAAPTQQTATPPRGSRAEGPPASAPSVRSQRGVAVPRAGAPASRPAASPARQGPARQDGGARRAPSRSGSGSN